VRSFFCHVLEEEVDGRGIGDVQGRRRLMRLWPSAMTEPESPLAEMAPDTSGGSRSKTVLNLKSSSKLNILNGKICIKVILIYTIRQAAGKRFT